jgi:predicted nuclease with RNAse H fold/dephospho-CoA kinase
MFLDIETTGLSRHYHDLTLVGWSMGQSYSWVSNDPTTVDLSSFLENLDSAFAVVTFNGSHFDVPFLSSSLSTPLLVPVHVDLRHAVRRVGFSGAQKALEKELDIPRPTGLDTLSGSDAPALWFRYQRGDLSALELLVRYNHADVEGLKRILERVVTEHLPGFDFAGFASSEVEVGGGVPGIKAFGGPAGPRVRLSDLSVETLRVVGIDLAGSDRARTGWSLVSGESAATAALRTDDEILRATLESYPDLVSIDAPLSLPVGRMSVDDEDPGRAEFGISRQAERVLWSRGVGTYPSLIRSMQSLTARGIRLAEELRSQGIPVIESFPGAMQDILGMPRKGVSVEFLARSLIEFGLLDDFSSTDITHDELDAISSAIVGQFFWSGYFEPLGNDDEDYMIVPSLSPSPQPRLVVGLSGPDGSGKTSLASRLGDVGFAQRSYGDEIRRIAEERLAPTDRSSLRAIGQDVNASKGQRWLGRRVLSGIDSRTDLVVVDGLRYPADHAFMVERFGSRFLHIHLHVEDEVRLRRLAQRDGRPHYASGMPLAESRLTVLRTLAHESWDNSGTLADLAGFAARIRANGEKE